MDIYSMALRGAKAFILHCGNTCVV